MEFDESALMRIQAMWRGAVVRKRMAAVRDAFRQVATEIEETQMLKSTWHGPLVYLPFQTKQLPDENYPSDDSVRLKDGLENPDDQSVSKDTCQKKHLANKAHVTSVGDRVKDNDIQKDSNLTVGSARDGSSPSSHAQSDSTSTHSSKVAASSPSSTPHSVSSGQEMQDQRRPHSGSDFVEAHDNTSVWDSLDVSHVTRQSLQTPLPDLNCMNKEQLENQRSQIAMELLWMQQAIQSRKVYLHLKQQMMASD